jgi:uncharacterized protein (TIGR02996 family)
MASLESQLKRVLANPKSDDERLVYADLLLEDDDPHGEFIILQLSKGLSNEQKERMEALEHKFARQFSDVDYYGFLAGERTFRRGFMVGCQVRTDLALQELGNSVVCQALLESLETNAVNDLGPIRHLRGLKTLTLHSGNDYEGNRRVGNNLLKPLSRLPALIRLAITGYQLSDLSPLATLPKLVELSISYEGNLDLKPLSSISTLRHLVIDMEEDSNATFDNDLSLVKQAIPKLRVELCYYEPYSYE